MTQGIESNGVEPDVKGTNGKSSFDKVDGSYTDGVSHACVSMSIGVLNSETNAHKQTLLHKLGGREMLRLAVDRFYDRLVQDKQLQPFFGSTNMQLLKWHQFNFMSIAFDNTITHDYDMSTLILERHRNLFDSGLNEAHFDAMMNCFVFTLQDLKIKQELIDEALSILNRLRPAFVQGSALARNRKEQRKIRCAIQASAVIALIGIGIVRFYRPVSPKK